MGIWSRHWIDKSLHFNNIVAQYLFQQIKQYLTCWDLFYNRRHILTKLTSFFKRKLEKNKTSNIFYDPDKHFWSNIFLCYFLIVTNFIQLKFHFFKFIFFLTWIIFKLPYEIYIYIFKFNDRQRNWTFYRIIIRVQQCIAFIFLWTIDHYRATRSLRLGTSTSRTAILLPSIILTKHVWAHLLLLSF